MKKLIIASALAFSLAGCAGGLTPASVATAITGINTTVAEVQTVSKEICSFVPAAATVSSIISQFIPGLSTAQAIATSICNAMSPTSVTAARRGRTVPTVAGVPIHGRFVAH